MIRTSGLAALALAVLAGCSGKVVPVNVTVLTSVCGSSPARKASDGVDHYKVVITGPDIDPIERTYSSGAVAPLDQLPPGHARVLTLTGYAGDPASGNAVVKAWGQSAPFDIPETTSGTVQVTVVLRAAGQFAGVPLVKDETTCATLAVPRAGHTATLLSDGRVLIAGGYNLAPDGGAALVTRTVAAGSTSSAWTYLDTYEIFDPATNESTLQTQAQSKIVDENQNPPYEESVAFHTATLLPDGKVLLYGGETQGYARPNGMVFDPSSSAWTYKYAVAGSADNGNIPELPSGTPLDRSHHVAIADSSGRVVIAGGVHYDSTGNAQLTPNLLWFDPTDESFHPVLGFASDAGLGGPPKSFGVTNLAVSTVLGGAGVAFGGGEDLDGGFASPVISFVQMQPWGANQYMTFLPSPLVNADNPPRVRAAISPLGPEQHLLVLAGGSGPDGSFVAETSVLDSTAPSTHMAIPLDPTRARNDPCAAFLPDGRVLVAGGEGANHVTSSAADLYSEDAYTYFPDDAGSSAQASKKPAGDLGTSRYEHTCTVLQDGSVLVTGGVHEEGGNLQVLNSIELYTPVPLN